MKFCKNNWKDLQKYFEHSFIKFPSIAGDEAVFVEKVTSDYMSGRQLPDENGSTEWQFTFGATNTEVCFILPLKSFFEYDGAAYLLYRNPARQYSRGCTSENTTIVKLSGREFFGMDIGLSLINAYTQKPAFTGFRQDYGNSYPVSRRMAVDAEGRLFIDTTCIGHYNASKSEIKVSYDMFVPEVERVVAASLQDIKIVAVTTKPRVSRKKPAPLPVPAPTFWVDTGVVAVDLTQATLTCATQSWLDQQLEEMENANTQTI